MFQNMVQPLLAQANRIARDDDDLKQDILSMAYCTYKSALIRGKDLSIGELVNVMKYRAGDLRCGNRLNFGSISKRTRQDVYNKRNYYNGDVKLFSIDFTMHHSEDKEQSFNRSRELTNATGRKDESDAVLFQIGFERFFQQLTPEDRQMLVLRLKGYNYSEIKRLVDFDVGRVQTHLKKIGRSFIEYFQLPECYLSRYGLA